MTQHAILVKHEDVLTRLPRVLTLVHKGFSVFVPMHGRCGCLFNPPSQTDLSQHRRSITYADFVADVRVYLEQVERGSNLDITGDGVLIGAISRCDSHRLVLLG